MSDEFAHVLAYKRLAAAIADGREYVVVIQHDERREYLIDGVSYISTCKPGRTIPVLQAAIATAKIL